MPADRVQSGLFDTPAKQRLMGVVDLLKVQYGRDTLSFARAGRKFERGRGAAMRTAAPIERSSNISLSGRTG